MGWGKGCENPVSQIVPKLFTVLGGGKVVNKKHFSFPQENYNFHLVP
jgi:hypothetical protein